MDKDPPEKAAVLQTPEWVADTEDVTKAISSTADSEEEPITSADLEPTTLPWSEKKPEPQTPAGQDEETTSVRSDSVSLPGGVSQTESEREFGTKEKHKEAEEWMERPKKRDSGMKLGNGAKSASFSEIEVEESNIMPEKAAGVFSPTITILRSTSQQEYLMERVENCRDEEVRNPFLGMHSTHRTPLENYHDYSYWETESKSYCCIYSDSGREALKLCASMFTSALIFPLMVWGGYVFLPFDAPPLDSAPLRLVYTLRCSVFAVIPIVLGVLVLGMARLWYRSLKPRFEGEREIKEVAVHRRYVEDSTSLFLLYFLQLSVMAAYLNQDLLKLVPLLTIVFAFGRLLYWIAAACDSSVRGVGFGFCFLPIVVMLVANLYFIFLSDSAGSMFAPDTPEPPVPPVRQRFWG